MKSASSSTSTSYSSGGAPVDGVDQSTRRSKGSKVTQLERVLFRCFVSAEGLEAMRYPASRTPPLVPSAPVDQPVLSYPGALPPSPAPPGQGCPQLHRPAATGRR